jgi:nucleoside-diphosphate-sugar epimerase
MNQLKSKIVLVTGAAGHLGSHLVPMLAEMGFEVRGLDMASPAASLANVCDFTQADLSDRDALRTAMTGVDIVVHTASIHPWKSYTDDQYLDANVKGTWSLYAVAAELGIERIVLTSSIAAIGYANIPMTSWPVGEMDMFPLGDIYSYTKYTQETVARMYADAGTIRTFALRPPAFMPADPMATCLAMTGAFAVVDDIVRAHVEAVHVMLGLKGEVTDRLGAFEAFNVVNALPYTAAMCEAAGGDTKRIIELGWPDHCEWLFAQGVTGPGTSYDIWKAERYLGWTPQFNLPEAIAAVTESD